MGLLSSLGGAFLRAVQGGGVGRAGREPLQADTPLPHSSTAPPPSPPRPPPRSPFTFPPVERMGQVAVRIQDLTHGYGGRPLFQGADLVIERGERVAIIGPNGARRQGVGWGGGGGTAEGRGAGRPTQQAGASLARPPSERPPAPTPAQAPASPPSCGC